MPASPGLLALAPETAPAALFALLLGLGVVLQVAGRFYASRCAFLFGAALVAGAGIFDRDPVLAVGQLALVAALCPGVREKSRRSQDGRVRKAG